MTFKLYTLDNRFIEETKEYPHDFTGIVKHLHGSKEWLKNGKRHRLDGPAWEGNLSGARTYWFDGKIYAEQQHKLLVDIMKLKGLL